MDILSLSAGRPVRRAAAFLLVFALCCPGLAMAKAKNVIMLIPDGVSSEQYTLTRWFKGAPLTLDSIRSGAVKTFIADSVVADSAPAGTAYATGVRTSDKFIGVGPKADVLPVLETPAEDLRYKPLANVLEGAKLLGKSTGLVATSRVTHATPADFAAHVPSRAMENEIMEQLVHQDVDVVMGGGRRHLLPKDQKGKREDGEDLTKVLEARGYAMPKKADELAAVTSGKVFAMFAGSHMTAELDRKELAPNDPSLADMTAKAIELLSANPKGFFLMVEGSQIDWADHANDPGHLLSDTLAFDDAVKIALDFAKKNKDTLVLVASDHNTGGMSIGNYSTSSTYSQTKLDKLLDPLKKMKRSVGAMWDRIGDEKTPEKIKAEVADSWGLEITDEDAAKILEVSKQYEGDPSYAIGEVLCPKYTLIGWTTHGHTGGDVPFFSYGPDRPVGLFDAPEVGGLLAEGLGLDMNKLNARLFVEPAKALPGAEAALDETDKANPVIKVTFKGKTAELPTDKNILKMDGKETLLEGVAVYAPDTGKAYIPLQAANLIAGKKDKLPGVSK